MPKNLMTLGGFSRHLLTGVAAAALFTGAPAWAQDDTDIVEEEERLVVTGSRIARSDVTSENPITVVSGEDILNSGFSNIAEVLRNSIAAGSGGFSQSSVLSGAGAASLDLRNLGQNRVLVLINGKRIASFTDVLANNATDLSTVPVAAVDRIEILRDGASATYGADAVSGVINIILKDNFEGLSVSAFGGISDQADAEQYQISAVMGGNFERGNIMVSAEYRFQDNLPQRERDHQIPVISSLTDSGDPDNPATGFNNGSFFSPGGLFLGDQGALFCTVPKVFGGDEVTNDLANCPSLQTPNSRNDLARYDYALEQDIITGSQLFSASIYGNYEITDWLDFVLEGQVANRESTINLDGNPGSFGTVGVPLGSRVPATNPNNPTGEDGSFFFRPSSTIGIRTTEVDSDMFRFVPSLRADMSEFGLEGFELEFAYIWSKVNSLANSQNSWNLQRFNIISDPDRCAGDEICSQVVNPSGALDSLRPGNWTQAEINYMRNDQRSQSKFELSQWFALLTGEAFELPAGPVGIAVGFERRREEGENLPDSIVESGASVANQNFKTSGFFTVNEFFGEVNVPVFKDAFLADDLSLNLQGRWFDFSNFGSDSVWKVGVNWQVSEDIRFRLNRGTSFRAPTITNLFGGGTVSFDAVTDPCQAYGNLDPTQGNNANIIANCAADGLAPNFAQPSGQYSALSGSNPNLEPETADTLSVGVILTPRWIPNFSIAVDYWDIEVSNLISRVTTDSLVDDCYESTPVLSDPFCATFTRNAITGAPIGLVNVLDNQATVLETDGIDWMVSYGFEGDTIGLDGVNFLLDWQGTMVFENTFFPGAGGADGLGSFVDVRQIFSGTALWGDLGFTWRTRYIDDLEDPQFSGGNAFGYSGTDVHWEHDIRVNYTMNTLDLSFGINNVFDEEPPFIQDTGTNTDPFTFGTAVLGRYYFARVTANF